MVSGGWFHDFPLSCGWLYIIEWKLCHRSHYMDIAIEIHGQNSSSILTSTVAKKSEFGIIKTIRFPNYLNLSYGTRSHGTRETMGIFVWIPSWGLELSTYRANTLIGYCVIGHNRKSTVILISLNKETREAIKHLFENGIFIQAIAQICGVNRTTVWSVIKAKTVYKTRRIGRTQRNPKL